MRANNFSPRVTAVDIKYRSIVDRRITLNTLILLEYSPRRYDGAVEIAICFGARDATAAE